MTKAMVRAAGSLATMSKMLGRAEEGDKEALSTLKELFDKNPRLWEEYGNLALQAELALVAMAAGDNHLQREAMQRKLTAMKEDLAGPKPTPLDRLLAERVATCWFQVQYADAACAQMTNGGVTFEQGDYYQRRQDRAHRRYLSAVRTLAQVRRLLMPAMQVNIGARQVNLAQVTSK